MIVGVWIVSILNMHPGIVFAAEIAIVGIGQQVIELCKINLANDLVRTFWRDADGSFFGTFAKLATSLNQHGERLVCASNAGIYGKDLRPLGLYVENGQVLRHLNTRKEGYGNFYLQPNGVFWLTERSASLATTDEVQGQWEQIAPLIRFATQSGPILFQGKQINPCFRQLQRIGLSETRFV